MQVCNALKKYFFYYFSDVVFALVLSFCYCQKLNYYCSFDDGRSGDCNFTDTSGVNSLGTTDQINSAGNPTAPLSDVSSISK